MSAPTVTPASEADPWSRIVDTLLLAMAAESCCTLHESGRRDVSRGPGETSASW